MHVGMAQFVLDENSNQVQTGGKQLDDGIGTSSSVVNGSSTVGHKWKLIT